MKNKFENMKPLGTSDPLNEKLPCLAILFYDRRAFRFVFCPGQLPLKNYNETGPLFELFDAYGPFSRIFIYDSPVKM
jgi:hypothetical protein